MTRTEVVMRKQVLDQLLKSRLVVIIRVEDPGDIPAIVDCLVEGGVWVLEVTSNTPGWENAVARVQQDHPDLLVGAGTITTVELAKKAIAAGARFLVTPNTRPELVALAHHHEVPVVMGAMTPTEVADAMEAKADVVKLFPAGSLGVGYLKSLARGPFLDTIFFAVGGVDEHNISEWMENGAAGVGIGGSLANPVPTRADAERLLARIRQITSYLESMG